MAVDITNIRKSGFSQTDQIYYGSSEISQVYWGNSLLWEKGGSFTPAWYEYTTDYVILAEYTPSSNVTVDSFTMKLNTNTLVYNYVAGIYNANGTAVVNQTGTSNVSIVANGTLGAETIYDHTITYPAGPTLTAGNSYFFCLAERYAAYKALTGEAPNAGIAGEAFGWSMANTSTTPSPIPTNSSVNIYLEVNTS